MKKVLRLFFTASLILVLCFGFASCDLTNPNNNPVHTHSFVNGVCTCGASDPSYVPPHEHHFVEGKCECGFYDVNYIPPHDCVFFEGKCITCGKDDPNPNYVLTGDYGVSAEISQYYTATVVTVPVNTEESKEVQSALAENNVSLDDRAWVAYNFVITPKEDENPSEDDGWQYRIVIPAPIPEEEDYVVWRVDEEEAEEVESTYEDENIIVYGEYKENHNVNYVVYTEQPFNVVEYYETHESATIPEHINVGNDTAEDAYQKGLPRSLNVYVTVGGLEIVNDPEKNSWIHVYGLPLDMYNEHKEDFVYKEIVDLNAHRRVQDFYPLLFAGWYEGEIREDGSILLEDDPYSTEADVFFEMPARDLTLFAVYDRFYMVSIRGINGQVSVNGGAFEYGSVAEVCYEKNLTLTVQPDENCYFGGWAPVDRPGEIFSTDTTLVYETYQDCEGVVAVCMPYNKVNIRNVGVCSEPVADGDYAEYRFLIDGEPYYDDWFEGEIWEYQGMTLTAVPAKNCRFIGWAEVRSTGDGWSDAWSYEYLRACAENAVAQNPAYGDPTFVIEANYNLSYEGSYLIAVYEMLPQYTFQAECFFVDDQYGSFASLYLNGEARGDNFYMERMAEGGQVTLKAVPEMNCKFAGWYTVQIVDMATHMEMRPKDLISSDAEYTFTMGNADMVVMAKFECYPTYSISAYAGEGGDIYINGENHYGSIRHSYEEGEKLAIQIEVKEGFEFKGWYAYDGNSERLITADLQFEYTVGTSDADFEARLVPIIYYTLTLDITSAGITVNLDDSEGLTYIPDGQTNRVYVTSRREGDTVVLKANDVEGSGLEFSHWLINGEIVGEREYAFTVGAADVSIRAVARAEVQSLELRYMSNSACKVVYSTDYDTGKRYISTVSVDEGVVMVPKMADRLFECLYILKRDSSGESYYLDIFEQCTVDFGGAIENDDYVFQKPGRYTVTVTDKSNEALSIRFTLQVVGYDATGTYVWVSRTGAKYHIYPNCSNMQTVTAMTVAEAEAAGYTPCKVCSE